MAAEALRNEGIFFQKITGEEGTTPQARFQMKNERQRILENFEAGHLDVLLAIDCLDEGVDIPAAQIGIILASSGNPKEFIQRRGRLMRRFPGKTKSRIFDFAVLPDTPPTSGGIDQAGGVLQLVPDALRLSELRRIGEFAEDAINASEVHAAVSHLTKGDAIN
jgi:superfamily II DNA/RNA helicase